MQIDPQLQKLTELIEQKRVQQNLRPSSNVAGRAGNPKFAEAARRVQLAREGKWTAGASQSSQANTSTNQLTTNGVSSTMNTGLLSSISATKRAEELTGVGASGHLYSTGSTQATTAANPPHLGRKFDQYA